MYNEKLPWDKFVLCISYTYFYIPMKTCTHKVVSLSYVHNGNVFTVCMMSPIEINNYVPFKPPILSEKDGYTVTELPTNVTDMSYYRLHNKHSNI